MVTLLFHIKVVQVDLQGVMGFITIIDFHVFKFYGSIDAYSKEDGWLWLI